jgi:hypothetical protein
MLFMSIVLDFTQINLSRLMFMSLSPLVGFTSSPRPSILHS